HTLHTRRRTIHQSFRPAFRRIIFIDFPRISPKSHFQSPSEGSCMARTRYTSNFCGYCNKRTRMQIVGEMQGVRDKIWYRCTRCHHMKLIDLKAQAQGAAAAKLDASSATPYTPEARFNIGDAIFHTEWNDVGRVLSTTRTSSGG